MNMITTEDKIYYRKGYRYQLSRSVALNTHIRPDRVLVAGYVSLSVDGVLLIKKGYAWDGASSIAINTDAAKYASVFHDALYQLIRVGSLDPVHRKCADIIYKQACIRGGMSLARAWAQYTALRLFGEPATRPSAEPTEMIAP